VSVQRLTPHPTQSGWFQR